MSHRTFEPGAGHVGTSHDTLTGPVKSPPPTPTGHVGTPHDTPTGPVGTPRDTRTAPPKPTEPTEPNPTPAWRTHLPPLAFFLALSLAWSWPWAALDGTTFPARQFDLYGVLWVIAHARDLLVDLRSSVSGLPLGENVSRLDTWVLAAIGAALPNVDPLRVAQAIVLLGPVASAFAAERCAARGLGVPRPWSLVAGVVYGFSGLGATALLEGHVYVLLAPWLPLAAWALLAATGPGGTVRHGALAGFAWALALLTSAYFGVVATLLALGLGVRGLATRLDRAPLRRAALGFGAVALPIGVVYVDVFVGGAGGVAGNASMVAEGGSASLATLATWSPDIDLANHSIAAPLGFGALALVLAAPVVLRGRSGWRALTALAALAVVGSLGPAIQAGMGALGTWYLVDPQDPPAFFAFLHFPVRLLWLWYLCAGLVAAQVAARLHATAGRAALGLLPLLVADAFLTSGVPFRIGAVDASVPTAYFAAPDDRPLLELFWEDPDEGDGIDLRVRRFACWYQVRHGRPLLGRCLTPHGAPAEIDAERALRAALLDGDDPRPALAGVDVGGIALHLDLVRPEDRARVLTGLTAAFGPPLGPETLATAFVDGPRPGGETVLVFPVTPAPSDATPAHSDAPTAPDVAEAPADR